MGWNDLPGPSQEMARGYGSVTGWGGPSSHRRDGRDRLPLADELAVGLEKSLISYSPQDVYYDTSIVRNIPLSGGVSES